MKVAIPSETGEGLTSTRSGHFGHTPWFTLVTIEDGQVTGVAVTDHRETVGVGTQATESGYLSQYTGRSGTIRPSGPNAVEAVSGATATSEAVTACVNQALAIVASLDTEGEVDYVDGEV